MHYINFDCKRPPLPCLPPSLVPPLPWLFTVRLAVFRRGGVVVEPLGHEVHCQGVLAARRLLDLGTFILEPDFNLGLVKPELLGQALPPLLRQVPVRLELGLESLQLLGGEGGAGPLVLLVGVLLLWFAGAGTYGRERREAPTPPRSAAGGSAGAVPPGGTHAPPAPHGHPPHTTPPKKNKSRFVLPLPEDAREEAEREPQLPPNAPAGCAAGRASSAAPVAALSTPATNTFTDPFNLGGARQVQPAPEAAARS